MPATQIAIPTVAESPTTPLMLAAEALGMSRATAYRGAAEGWLTANVRVLKIRDGRYRVSTAELRRELGLPE